MFAKAHYFVVVEVFLVIVLSTFLPCSAWISVIAPRAQRRNKNYHGRYYQQRTSLAPLVRKQSSTCNSKDGTNATATTLSSPSNATTSADDLDDQESQQQQERKLRFGGVGRLYSSSSSSTMNDDDQEYLILQRLQHSTAVIIGLGGVGSWAAEALCRSGIGHLCLVDFDDVCISNTNRQLHALSDTVGQFKIDAMKQRLLAINPQCNITLVHDFVMSDNVHSILTACCNDMTKTVILDAMDGSREKAALFSACADLRLPVVTCGGAAGRKDPTRVVWKDIIDVKGDPLIRSTRKDLKKHHGFQSNPKKRRRWKIDCVYSEERTDLMNNKPASAVSTNNNNEVSSSSPMRICDSGLGTASFVTGTFGFVAASRVVDKIVSSSKNKMACPSRGYRPRVVPKTTTTTPEQ